MRFGTCNTCGSDFPILELFAHVYACRAQHDADAEEAPLLRAKLAEARALLKTTRWLFMGDDISQEDLRCEIDAWLAANPVTEAKR